MTTRLNPYLSFRDTAKEAMDFYQSVFGGEMTSTTFGQFQMGDDTEKDKIMHADLVTESGLCLMGADTPNEMEHHPGTNGSISISGDDEAELRGYWDKLVDGGVKTLALEKAPWGDSFGMCIDKYGISWLVNISGSAA
ncbi:MAG: VOC family protein [Leifsonia sp.]